MRGLEFILILLLGGVALVTLKDDLRLRDALAVANVGLTHAADAAKADTASASQGQLRCSTEARSAVNVGRAIGRIATPRTASAGSRPMVSAADIRSVAQP